MMYMVVNGVEKTRKIIFIDFLCQIFMIFLFILCLEYEFFV